MHQNRNFFEITHTKNVQVLYNWHSLNSSNCVPRPHGTQLAMDFIIQQFLLFAVNPNPQALGKYMRVLFIYCQSVETGSTQPVAAIYSRSLEFCGMK